MLSNFIYVSNVKSTVKISSNFVAFIENINLPHGIIISMYLQLQFKIEKKELESTTYLNIMDGFQWNEIFSRFPHIAEEIFKGLDDQSLTSCR